MSVAGRRIVLGVSGGVAAYKAVEVCRRLMDAGAHVAPILTPNATQVHRRRNVLGRRVRAGPDLALRQPGRPEPAHAARPVRRSDRGRARHRSALVASTPPATPRACSSRRCWPRERPVLLCPAMHTEMWEHPAVQDNLASPAAPRRARARAGESATSPAATSAPGACPIPSTSCGPRRPCWRRRISRACASWSPPAAPGRRSTPCASSPIDRRASKATPSPKPQRRAARRSPSSPRRTAPCPRASSVWRSTARPRCAAAVGAHRDASDVIVMAAAVADFRPAHPADEQDQEGRRRADDRAGADRGHPPAASATPSGPVSCWSASPPKPTTSSPTPPRQTATQEPRPDRRQRRRRARRRALTTTPTPSTIVGPDGPVARHPSVIQTRCRPSLARRGRSLVYPGAIS